MTNPGRNSSLRRLGDENPTRIGPAGLAVPVPAASPTGGPHTVCAAIKSPTHRRAVASRPAPRGRSGHRPPPPRPRPALRRGLLSPVSTFGVRNPQAQSAPGGSRQVGEDRAPSTTVDGDPPWLPPPYSTRAFANHTWALVVRDERGVGCGADASLAEPLRVYEGGNRRGSMGGVQQGPG